MQRSNIPDIEETAILADWIEINLFYGDRGFITQPEIRRILATATEHESEDIEVAINFLVEEIKTRQDITPEGYPFKVDGLKIFLDPEANQEFYKFLLLVEFQKDSLSNARRAEASNIFDELAQETFKNYLGPGTNVLRFAWPPQQQRPADFESALDWLSTNVCLPRGVAQNSPNLKDGGVDVVAWKPFPDNRTGFVFALAQCTIQRDWFSKAKDTNATVWSQRIHSGREAITALMVPFLIPKNFSRWDELRTILDVVFERFRISFCLAHTDSTRFPAMVAWSQTEMSCL